MVRASRLLMSLARWGKWSEKISVKTVIMDKECCERKVPYLKIWRTINVKK